MYVYIYIYTIINIYVYIYIIVYIYILICTYVCIYIHIDMYIVMCIYIYTLYIYNTYYIHIYVYIYIYTQYIKITIKSPWMGGIPAIPSPTSYGSQGIIGFTHFLEKHRDWGGHKKRPGHRQSPQVSGCIKALLVDDFI